MTKFKSFIIKANNNGTGFITIPKNLRTKFKRGDNLKVLISRNGLKTSFYGKICYWGRLGIYVSKHLTKRYTLFGKEHLIILEKAEGFFSKVCCDGRIYLPSDTSRKSGLKDGSIIKLSIGFDGEKICRYLKVHCRKKANTTEYFCMAGTDLASKEVVGNIEKILQKPDLRGFPLSIISDLNSGVIDKDTTVIYDGHKVPIVVNNNLKLEGIAHYLGAFFADGTRKGNSWGIVASTFEQAKYYLSQHEKIVSDTETEKYVSITSNAPVNKTSLRDTWINNTRMLPDYIRVHKTKTKHSKNRNVFGSLVFREHRKLVQDYYNRLLIYLFELIEKDNRGDLATDFILGVLEGDGSPSAANKGYIIISTNKEDSKVLQKILQFTDFDFKFHIESKTNKHYIRINSLSILKILPEIKDRIFRYYPKRRKKFIERFCKMGAVLFILGEQNHASGWVKANLRKSDILNSEYKLTSHGNEIRQCLKDMLNEYPPV
jgi:bifunctional DNA-binding transcriptional regulator/antitoxin component of YhaV-PrlF toxin-antitoxin module